MHLADIDRRQFVLRGSAVAAALMLLGHLPQKAEADVPLSLTASETGVLNGLVSSIALVVGATPGDPEALGLQLPAAIAAAYASSDSYTQLAVSTLLDAIDAAPASGAFSSLTATQQEAFVAQALAAIPQYQATSQDIADLNALTASTNALTAQLQTQPVPHVTYPLGVGVVVPGATAPTISATPSPPSAATILAECLISGLTLVSEPLIAATPVPAPAPLSTANASALTAWLAGPTPTASLPPALLASIVAETAQGPDPTPDPIIYPASVLDTALGAWLQA